MSVASGRIRRTQEDVMSAVSLSPIRRPLIAALLVVTGVGTVLMTRNTEQLGEPTQMIRIEAYSAGRVDSAFDLVAELPAGAPPMLPLAQKGDLLVPPSCAGMRRETQAECTHVAYEVDSLPS